MANPVPTNLKVQEALNIAILQFTVTVLYPPVDPMVLPQDPTFIATLAAQAGFPALYWSDGAVQTFVSGGGRYTYTYQCRYATSPFVNVGLPGPRGPQGSTGPAGPSGYHPAAWDQPTWHIDPVAGNDANDGLTASTALQTAAEYGRRVGTVHEFNRNIIITIHGSLPESDCLNLAGARAVGWDAFYADAHNLPPFYLTVRGVPSVVTSGVAVSRAFDQLNNIPHGLSCVALGSLASHVKMGRMVRKTTGSNVTNTDTTIATSAWLAKDENGTIARMSFPGYLDDIHWSPIQCNQGVLNTGDNFEIVDLPQVPNVLFPVGTFRSVRFQLLRFMSGGVISGIQNAMFQMCAFDSFWGQVGGDTGITNCQFGGVFSLSAGASCYISQGLMLNALFINNGRAGIENYTLLQGCNTYLVSAAKEGSSAGVTCHTRGFGVFDSPTSGMVVPMGQLWEIAGTIYGSGNAGYALDVQRGGQLLAAAPSITRVFCLTGALGDFRVSGKTSGPAVTQTNPYAYTEDRAYTFANLALPVTAGGFDYNVIDPLNPGGGIVSGMVPQAPIGISGALGFHPAAWDQITWHIDPAAGNDLNDGLTLGTAIKTAAEYHRRVGTIHEYDRDITMTIHGSLPASDCLNLSGLRSSGSWSANYYFNIVGVPSVVTSGTVTTSRTFDQNNSVPHGVSCTALGSLASYIRMGRMVRKTNGTNSTDDTTHLATAAWLSKDENGVIARMSYPAFWDHSIAHVQCMQGAIDAGDTFDIVDLPQVPNVTFPLETVGAVRFQRLRFNSSTNYCPLNGYITFLQCAFDLAAVSEGCYANLSDCQFGWAAATSGGSELYITYGLMLGTTLGNDGRMSIENYTLLQGCYTWQANFTNEGMSAGISCHTRGFGVYDSPISGLLVPMGQVWQIAGTIYGSGNTGYAIEVLPGGKLNVYGPSLTDVFVLTGIAGDIKVGGRTSGPAVATTSPWGYIAPDRAYTLANLKASVAAGGFNYNIFDPLNPSTCIVRGSF